MLSSGSVISSVAYQPSCFGVEFSLYLFTADLFLCLTSFLWGKVSDPSAGGPLLSACCDGLLFVFNFAGPFDFGCCSLAQKMSLWTTACPISGSGLSPACCWPFCLSSFCLLKGHVEISSLFLPTFPVCFQSSHPLFYVLAFSSLFIIQVFCVYGVSFPRGLCWFILRVAG
jgi:hypothetical protein